MNVFVAEVPPASPGLSGKGVVASQANFGNRRNVRAVHGDTSDNLSDKKERLPLSGTYIACLWILNTWGHRTDLFVCTTASLRDIMKKPLRTTPRQSVTVTFLVIYARVA